MEHTVISSTNGGSLRHTKQLGIFDKNSSIRPHGNEIKRVELSDRRLSELLNSSSHAEGCAAWFQCLKDSTLRSGEEACGLLLIDGDGQPRAAIPIVQSGGRVRGLTSPYTTFFAPAGIAEWTGELGRQLRRSCPWFQADAMDFGHAPTAAFYAGLRAGGLATAKYSHFINWHEAVMGYERYWQERSSRLQNLIKRKSKKLQHLGPMYSLATTASAVSEGLGFYEAVHRTSWKMPEPHPQFLPSLAAHLGPAGKMAVGMLSLEGQPAAAQIWLLHDGAATIFKLAYRESLSAQSPGSLLTAWMIEKVAALGPREIDFGRGDDGYKKQWLSRQRMRMGVFAADWRKPLGLTCLVTQVMPTRLSGVLHH